MDKLDLSAFSVQSVTANLQNSIIILWMFQTSIFHCRGAKFNVSFFNFKHFMLMQNRMEFKLLIKIHIIVLLYM
ncbi:hypothetical protein BUZ28_03895 [Staphylococcus borealis]|nr:hypothetical protein BUZ28_03895 [Staphylococcus borealis]RIO71763.1 hypothetical protein BUZ17_02300 [Staphylococcus borealis]